MPKRFFCLSLVIITHVASNRVVAMRESNFGQTKVLLKSSIAIVSRVLQCIRSSATRKAVEQLTAIARQYKEETIKQQVDSLYDKIKVLEQDKSKLLEENKKLDRKLVSILLKIQDQFPHKLWEKLVRCYQASCSAIEQSGNYVWTKTFKNRPYLTITVVVLSAGYGVHKKYGKKVKEVILKNLPDSYRAAASMSCDTAVSMKYDL
jgi:hypothetical protein